MIKDGMWFEDEAHYQYYLERSGKGKDKYEKLVADLWSPLIKMLDMMLLKQLS